MNRSIFAFLVVLVAVLCTACESTSFPPFENVVRIEVRTNLDAPIKAITDEQAVKSIVAFVNERSSGWETPWYGVLVPTVIANLYSGSTFLGHFGVGANFFETQRRGDFLSRPATDDERKKFMALLDVPFENIRGQ